MLTLSVHTLQFRALHFSEQRDVLRSTSVLVKADHPSSWLTKQSTAMHACKSCKQKDVDPVHIFLPVGLAQPVACKVFLADDPAT